MPIIGTLPSQILNGQYIDAVPLMNDLNYIVSQVNNNVPALVPVASSSITYVTAAQVGGTANAITLTPTAPVGAYAEGQSFRFVAKGTNTGAVTVATSGLAVRAVKNAMGGSLTGGELILGGTYDVADNGTNYVLVNDGASSAIGSWTPGLTFGGSAAGNTYAVQTGSYLKLNNIVFFTFYILLTNQGGNPGNVVITGLPYPINATWMGGGGTIPSGICDAGGWVTNGGWFMLNLLSGTTTMEPLNCVNNNVHFIVQANQVSSVPCVLGGSGFYPV